jgi:hypothetical protein
LLSIHFAVTVRTVARDNLKQFHGQPIIRLEWLASHAPVSNIAPKYPHGPVFRNSEADLVGKRSNCLQACVVTDTCQASRFVERLGSSSNPYAR